jgi:hypothetical protein
MTGGPQSIKAQQINVELNAFPSEMQKERQPVMSILKNIAVAGSMAALAMGMSALPAQAVSTAAGPAASGVLRAAPRSPSDCLNYLNSHGYSSTPQRVSACNSLIEAFCIEGLEDSQVPHAHALAACRLS